MRISDFLAKIGRGPRALAEIEGALHFDGIGHRLDGVERTLLERRKAELKRELARKRAA